MKPMLAATLEKLEDVKFPVYLSPKLDGIRCLIVGGVAVSRSLKPIPNKFIQEKLKGLPDGLDGELVVKINNKVGTFNETQSSVMSENGEPEFFYVLFDVLMEGDYLARYQVLHDTVVEYNNPFVKVVETRIVDDLEELQRIEHAYVKQGYEGVMLRSLDSLYKNGRSTVKQGWLLKYKRFKDDEGIVVDFLEKMHNNNEPTTDNLGYQVRSSKQEGLTPAGTLGALVVRYNNHIFKVIGFTEERAQEIWDNQDKYVNKSVTFTYTELNEYGIPRPPAVFKDFRYDK